jgi:hypothetical protein
MTVSLPDPYIVKADGSADAEGVQRDLTALALASPGTGIPRIVAGGKQNIPGAETTNSLAYTTLATPDTINVDALLNSVNWGLGSDGGAVGTTEVTTGLVVGQNAAGRGGACYAFAAAGTYAVSIQFKNNAAGTVTVSKRHLWVASYAFA